MVAKIMNMVFTQSKQIHKQKHLNLEKTVFLEKINVLVSCFVFLSDHSDTQL